MGVISVICICNFDVSFLPRLLSARNEFADSDDSSNEHKPMGRERSISAPNVCLNSVGEELFLEVRTYDNIILHSIPLSNPQAFYKTIYQSRGKNT